MMATMAGVPLYEACGYGEVEPVNITNIDGVAVPWCEWKNPWTDQTKNGRGRQDSNLRPSAPERILCPNKKLRRRDTGEASLDNPARKRLPSPTLCLGDIGASTADEAAGPPCGPPCNPTG